VPNQGNTAGGDYSHFVFCLKLLGEDGSVRRGIVKVKQPGLFSPKFGATYLHIFTQSLQNITVESIIHSFACWDKFFVHNPLDVMIMLLTLLFTCLAILALVMWGFSIGMTVAVSQGHNHKPRSQHQ
jgi:hypothetical protein